MAYFNSLKHWLLFKQDILKKSNHIIVYSNLQVDGIHLDTEVEVHFYNISLIHIYQIQGTNSLLYKKIL